MSEAWRVYRPPRERRTGADVEATTSTPAGVDRNGGVEEAVLWRRWREEKDEEARWALAELHRPYAQRIAARAFARRPHAGLEFGDYGQFAMVGLLESIDRYVPGGPAQFRTFATRRIQGAILNGLEHLDERLEQAAAWRRARRERAESLIPDQLGGRSAERLLADLGQIGVGLALGFILESSGMFCGPEAVRGDDLHAEVEVRQLRQRLWEAVTQLPARERRIIELHYREGRRFDEIAEALEVSKGRISQLHARAVRLLGEAMRNRERADVTV